MKIYQSLLVGKFVQQKMAPLMALRAERGRPRAWVITCWAAKLFITDWALSLCLGWGWELTGRGPALWWVVLLARGPWFYQRWNASPSITLSGLTAIQPNQRPPCEQSQGSFSLNKGLLSARGVPSCQDKSHTSLFLVKSRALLKSPYSPSFLLSLCIFLIHITNGKGFSNALKRAIQGVNTHICHRREPELNQACRGYLAPNCFHSNLTFLTIFSKTLLHLLCNLTPKCL